MERWWDLQEGGSRRSRFPAPLALALASVVAVAVGSVPSLIFWFWVRRPDGGYPANSEALVLVGTPVLAGIVFALLCPRPVWRRSVFFTLFLGLLVALFTVLAIYEGDEGLGPAPMAAIAVWALSWFFGALTAGLASRARNWAKQGGTLRQWSQDWWTRRRCSHDWELVQTRRLLGRVGHLRIAGGVGYHNLYLYRCRICGATRTRSDRWGPAPERRL